MKGRARRPPARYVDTRTRHKGVHARHRTSCSLALGGVECDCKPAYYGVVWDRSIGRARRTHHTAKVSQARRWRAELETMVRVNAIGARRPDLQFDEARRIFVTSCAEGVALNKQGRSYKPKAILNLDSSLRRLPAALVRLPAPDSVERDRIATPGEFARLPRCLESAEALPFALAAYGTARAQEIRILGWPQVDLEHRQMVLADEEGARKSRAAHRVVPLVRPLLDRLRFAWSSRPPP